jgi:hypothetical protein
MSSIVSAFGDESSTVNAVQFVDELGIKHQMLSLNKFFRTEKNK